MSGYDDRDSGSDEEPFNPQAEIDEDDVPVTSEPVRRPAATDDDDEDDDDDDEEDDDDDEEDEDDVVVCWAGIEMAASPR